MLGFLLELVRPVFEWVDSFPSSLAWRESLNGYVYLLTAHVVSMGLVAGIIGYWDMRLAGMALRWLPVSKVKSGLFPYLYVGVVVNAGTGLMMVYSQPMRYYPNFWFWFKMAMLVILAVNAAYFHLRIEKTVEQWENDPVAPAKARMAGYLSLAFWVGVIVTGRLTAYSGLVPQWWLDLGLG
ncbi:MAG: DUF6644 family protein [Acidobacteriota bacterium]|nr:DUF6644 family protein [Acidobacteriota bacterium]